MRSVFLMNGTELRSFSHFQILIWITYSDISRNLENWLIMKFVFIHCKTAKCQSRWSNSNVNMIYKCFLYERNRIKKFLSFSNFDKNRMPGPEQKSSNWLILEFVFIHCKTVKVSQNDQFRIWTCFTSVFFLNGTKLRTFNLFQILTWIEYSELRRNLENWLMLEFVFIHCKTVKISQNYQILL